MFSNTLGGVAQSPIRLNQDCVVFCSFETFWRVFSVYTCFFLQVWARVILSSQNMYLYIQDKLYFGEHLILGKYLSINLLSNSLGPEVYMYKAKFIFFLYFWFLSLWVGHNMRSLSSHFFSGSVSGWVSMWTHNQWWI